MQDRFGYQRGAQLYYASPKQVSFLIPSLTAEGEALVTIRTPKGDVVTAPLEIRRVAPGLFGIPGQQPMPPAALIVRLRNGVQSIEPMQRAANGDLMPIDIGPDTDQLWLVLFGTGLRLRSSLKEVTAELCNYGCAALPVEYAGPQGEYAGLDQVNVRVPRSVERGDPDLGYPALRLRVDGVYTTGLHLYFR